MEYSINNSYDEEGEEEEEKKEVDLAGGVGRCYECVFCKRGFNTAQALGGHMNIHRKDRRPRINKPPHPPNPILTYFPLPSTSTSTSTSTSRAAPSLYENRNRQLQDVGVDNWRMRLSLQEDELHCPQELLINNNKEKELDLELRLGGYQYSS